MRFRLPHSRWLGVLAFAPFASACTEPVPARSLAPPDAARLETSAPETLYTPNSRRYRDAGHQPSTGRAGSAALAVQSLIGRDGRTDVHVRAMRADDPWSAAATLQKVQLKGFSSDGRLLFSRNATNLSIDSMTLSAAGLQPGSVVQVEAVAGADSLRLGVVTVGDVVRRRPDLAIAEATVPLRAAMHSAPTLRAVVRELNGDVGSLADCVLEVDGTEVDRVYGMWVDAGGTVTCQFFHIFRALGSRGVRVRIDTYGQDWDDANNSAAGTIRIDPIPSMFSFSASFHDRTFAASSRSRWSAGAIDGSWGYHQEGEEAASGRTQDAWMTAYMPRAIGFPLDRLQVRQYTRDGTVQGFVLTDVPADYTHSWDGVTESCLRRALIPEFGGYGWVHICSIRSDPTEWSEAWEYTWADYYRNAGDVTYYSRGHTRFWDRIAGYEDVWTWNYDWTETYGRFATYGFEYAFFLRIDQGGAIHRANPFVWLASSEGEWSSPWQCWSWADEWYRSEQCQESSVLEQVVGGSVYGEPFTP